MPLIESGDELYRNYDCAFERELARNDVPRRLSINLLFTDTADGFSLAATAENGVQCKKEIVFNKDKARSPQRDNIVSQLKKWGNTPFEVKKIDVVLDEEWFVPSSLLSDMRRSLCDLLLEKTRLSTERADMRLKENSVPYISASLDYRGNVSNRLAKEFYREHGVTDIAPAFELEPVRGATVMFCKHCIKYSMGWCTKNGEKHQYKEPFYIVSGDGKRFRLSFDCKECLMKVIAEEE